MNKTIIGIVVALVAILAVGSVYAYQGMNAGSGFNGNVERDAAERAIEAGDYSAWKALHTGVNGKMVGLINEDNFHLLKEMHEARDSGDFDRMWEIKNEIGFQKGSGMHDGKGKGQGNMGNCPYA